MLGDTGTINLTDSTIIDLADTFYSDTSAGSSRWSSSAPYVLLTLERLPALARRASTAAALSGLVLRMSVVASA